MANGQSVAVQAELPYEMSQAEAARFIAWRSLVADLAVMDIAHERDKKRRRDKYEQDIAAINVKHEDSRGRD